MKRSEMVDKLYTHMLANSYGTGGLVGCPPHMSFFYEVDRDDANRILKIIEEAGMLPPTYKVLMKNGERYVREIHQGADTMLVKGRWEPEEDSE